MYLTVRLNELMEKARAAYSKGDALTYLALGEAGVIGQRSLPDDALEKVKERFKRVQSTEWYQNWGLTAQVAFTIGVHESLAPYGLSSRELYKKGFV